ncbi:MAG: lysine--tRNA ligase, partial [Clostridiales bacterium]|nr:lysine--tRNA ligase [Clostridiales bacterium]
MAKKFVPSTEPLSAEEIQEQTRFRMEKLKALQESGKDPYEELTYDVTHHSVEITGNYEALAGQTVRVAGRLMSKRGMGKVSFCDLYDRRGKIQIFTKIDNLPEEEYAAWQNLDIGDLVGVEGEVYMTEKGEVSILTKAYKLLAKCLHPLPNKYQGLKDTEVRYRQRYLDLIVNPQVKDTFEKRSKVIKEIRNFLADRDFMEVETPLLVTNAGGAAARPFTTHFNALDIDLKLRISLELYLKRLLVGGFERVFEIGRVFRNEGMDTRHNPEFTLMELYQAYTDYNGMMELTESMFRYVAEKVCGTTLIKYGDLEIDFGKPFERLTMNDAIKKYAGIDFDTVEGDEAAKKLAEEHHIEYEAWHTKGDIVNLFFEEYCEKNLLQPTFIMDHPLAISPLTKKKKGSPDKVERFELFINTWEMCNAYSELNDPIDQRERFAAQDATAEAGNDEADHTDEDFLNALELGMPPTGGIGYGIDRLV